MLTLKNAIETGRLPEFVVQEEARGIGPADSHALDALVAEAAFDEKLKAIAQQKIKALKEATDE